MFLIFKKAIRNAGVTLDENRDAPKAIPLHSQAMTLYVIEAVCNL